MHLKLTAITIATGIALLTGPLHAGGPVLEGEEPTIVSPDHDRKIGVLPILIGIGILAVLAGSGGGDVCYGDDPAPTPDDGGC